MSDEVDCHVRNGALIITPIRPEPTGEFAEEILADLVAQGLSGKQLLDKFAEMNRKVRPAVQALIARQIKQLQCLENLASSLKYSVLKNKMKLLTESTS